MKNTRFFSMMLVLIVALMVVLHFTGCEGCNKPAPVVPVNDAIVQQYSKQVDSLQEVQTILTTRIDSLQVELLKAEQQQQVAVKTANRTIARLKEALGKGDTTLIIDYGQDCADDFAAYVQVTEKEDSVQHQLITTQADKIKAQQSELSIQQLKFTKLNVAYSTLDAVHHQLETALKKSERKRKGAKLLNRLSVPIAIAGAAYFLLTIQ